MLNCVKLILMYIMLLTTAFASLALNTPPLNQPVKCGIAAPPFPLQKINTDGKTITYYVRGDGAVNWLEDEQGYTLIADSATGNLTYAVNANGTLKAINLNPTSTLNSKLFVLNQMATIPKHNPFTPQQITQKINNYLPNLNIKPTQAAPANSNGATHRILLLLVNYPDKQFTYTKAQIEALMNTNTLSFKAYYNEVSQGVLNYQVDVIDGITASNPHNYYGDYGDPDNITKVQELVAEAIDQAENQGVNFANYDNDQNGTVDAIAIIHQGTGAHYGDPTSIWAHQYQIPTAKNYDGVTIQRYIIQNELIQYPTSTTIQPIGIIAHEWGHVLGFEDLYDTNYSTNGQAEGLGAWDIMASGNYNSGGSLPAHMNAFFKSRVGWINDFNQLNSTTPNYQTIEYIGNSTALTYFNAGSSNEYFILENRQKIGFNNSPDLPGAGLLIYHVDLTTPIPYLQNTLNINPNHQYVDLEEADNTTAHGPGDAFGTTYHNFTDYTTPSARSWQNTNANLPITNIQQLNNQLISFNVGTNVNFYSNKDTSLTNTPIVYTNSSIGFSSNATYSWNFGANATPSAATGAGPHTVQYSSAGYKTVTLSITDNNQTLSNTHSNTVFICPDIPNLTITGPEAPCPETNVTYSIPVITDASYTWSYPSNWQPININGNQATLTVANNPGLVTVQATGGCAINLENLTIAVTPNLLTVNDLEIFGPTLTCADGITQHQYTAFSNTQALNNNLVYNWTITPPELGVINSSGNNNATITWTPHNTQSNTATLTAQVQVCDNNNLQTTVVTKPQFTINHNNINNETFSFSINHNDFENDVLSYTITNNSNTVVDTKPINFANNIQIFNLNQGHYTIEVASQAGCTASSNFYISGSSSNSVGFSPNGDGINDLFFAEQKITEPVSKACLKIISPNSGEELYNKCSTILRELVWDGQVKNNKQNAYFYEISFPENNISKQQGILRVAY